MQCIPLVCACPRKHAQTELYSSAQTAPTTVAERSAHAHSAATPTAAPRACFTSAVTSVNLFAYTVNCCWLLCCRSLSDVFVAGAVCFWRSNFRPQRHNVARSRGTQLRSRAAGAPCERGRQLLFRTAPRARASLQDSSANTYCTR